MLVGARAPSTIGKGVILVIQHPMVEEATKKCESCGLEMGETSPLAEHWYWQSDGIDGLICLCAPCARNISGQEAQDQQRRQPSA